MEFLILKTARCLLKNAKKCFFRHMKIYTYKLYRNTMDFLLEHGFVTNNLTNRTKPLSIKCITCKQVKKWCYILNRTHNIHYKYEREILLKHPFLFEEQRKSRKN